MTLASHLRAATSAATCCLCLATGAHAAMGERASGEALAIGQPADGNLSRISFDLERCGPFLRSSWRDVAQRLIAEDELEIENGALRGYRYWRANVNERARVVRLGSELRVELDEDGRLRKETLPVSGETVVGPMIALLAEQRLPSLIAGGRLQVRYAVPDRMATYGFTLFRNPEPNSPPRTFVLRPDSWIVRKAVNPMVLRFDANGAFAGFRGRMLPADGSPGHKQPLELDARVLRRDSGACSDQPRSF